MDYAPVLPDGRRGPVELSAYAPVTGPGWTVVATKDKDIAFAGLVHLRTTVLAIASLLVLIILAGVGVIVRSDRRRDCFSAESWPGAGSTDEGFVSIDGAGLYRWNTKRRRSTAGGEVLGRSAMETLVPRSPARSTPTILLATGRAARWSARESTDRRHRTATRSARGRRLGADDGDGFSAFVHDISERVAIQTALETERRRLTEAQRLGQMGGFECDLATDAWIYSDQMYEMWGVDPAACPARSSTG